MVTNVGLVNWRIYASFDLEGLKRIMSSNCYSLLLWKSMYKIILHLDWYQECCNSFLRTFCFVKYSSELTYCQPDHREQILSKSMSNCKHIVVYVVGIMSVVWLDFNAILLDPLEISHFLWLWYFFILHDNVIGKTVNLNYRSPGCKMFHYLAVMLWCYCCLSILLLLSGFTHVYEVCPILHFDCFGYGNPTASVSVMWFVYLLSRYSRELFMFYYSPVSVLML